MEMEPLVLLNGTGIRENRIDAKGGEVTVMVNLSCLTVYDAKKVRICSNAGEIAVLSGDFVTVAMESNSGTVDVYAAYPKLTVRSNFGLVSLYGRQGELDLQSGKAVARCEMLKSQIAEGASLDALCRRAFRPR